MKTPLAWRNVLQSKVRSVIALCGISFAILLIFMQLGFHAATGSSATNVYDALDFDVMVLSRQYVFMAHPTQFARSRLEQLRGFEGVVSVAPIRIGLGRWRNLESRDAWNIIAIGVDPAQRPFCNAALNDQLPLLKISGTALSDSLSRPEIGPLETGSISEVQNRRIRIVGRYAIGSGFVAGATLVTSRETFLRVFKEADPEKINLGLVRLLPGTSAEIVAQEMTRRLWPEATALTRAQISRAERRYWLKVKPIGIMFTSGVLIAFLAGAIILYQVLTSEVQNRLREYATLKALGYDDRFVHGVVARQALIFAGLGFVPAFFLALALYFLLRTQALVPVNMEPGRVAGVLFLTALMCLSATSLAVRKLRKANPADLF